MNRPRAALIAFCFALAIMHAIVAAWTPIQGEDWGHWIWAAQHDGDGIGTWLAAHFTFSDAIGYFLARCRSGHILVTPVAVMALVIGVFVVAMRRTPRASWCDVLGIALVSALIWLAQPRAGIAWFHTPDVALYVYGTALAAWFIAPLYAGWQVPRWLWPVMAIMGYCVGTSTRAIATATLVGFMVALRKAPRPRWLWYAFGGLVVGTIVGYAKSPWIEFGKVIRRGLDPNLVLYKLPLQQAGELVSLVLGLVLVDRVLGELGKSRADGDAGPDPRPTWRWFLIWFAMSIWCMFGPRYSEATLLPATCAMIVAALPYLLWLATSRWLRWVLVGIVVGTHAIVWSSSVIRYRHYGAESDRRLATFQHTQRGTVALIPAYSDVLPTFWFFGEDQTGSNPRQFLAIEAFGLRDIEISPPFRRYEPNPKIELVLETEGVSDADLRAANVPAIWGTNLATARHQFERFIDRLHELAGNGVRARLVVTNVDLPARGKRPLLAAWADAKATVVPKIARSPADANDRYTIRIYPPDDSRFTEAWLVAGGVATSISYRGGTPRTQPMVMALNVIIACNADYCLAADAFLPRF